MQPANIIVCCYGSFGVLTCAGLLQFGYFKVSGNVKLPLVSLLAGQLRPVVLEGENGSSDLFHPKQNSSNQCLKGNQNQLQLKEEVDQKTIYVEACIMEFS